MKDKYKIIEKNPIGTILGISLAILTLISLLIDYIAITNSIYSNVVTIKNNIANLNSIVSNFYFTAIFLIDNLAIYTLSIFYIANAIYYRNNITITIFYSLFSILTTILVSLYIIHLISKVFHII